MSNISICLQECQDIEQVVKLINGGGSSDEDGDEISGQYAYDAAEDKVEWEFRAHLEFLEEAGAKFDYVKALETAKEMID